MSRTYDLIQTELSKIDLDRLARNPEKVEGIVTGGRLSVPNPPMTALPSLKVIGIDGVGFDNVDLDLPRSTAASLLQKGLFPAVSGAPRAG